MCVVGQGQGGLLAMSCPKPQNEICLGTRDWRKTSEFNSKHLEKKGRKKMLSPVSGTDLRLTSALLSPTLGELH